MQLPLHLREWLLLCLIVGGRDTMQIIPVKCSGCGAPLKLEVAVPFAAATVAATFCSDCTDQQFLDQGGAVVSLRREMEGARFALGKITITSGAVAALAAASQHAME